MRSIQALILGLVAFPVMAQDDPPDYLTFYSKVERYAFAANSVGSCQHFDYIIDERGLLAAGQRMIDDAVVAGMPEASANTLMVGELEAEGERQAARLPNQVTREADPGAIESFLDYWQRRCDSLASDPFYGEYFRRQ